MAKPECEKPMTSRDSLAYSSSSSSLPSLGRACNSSSSSASCFLLRVDMVWDRGLLWDEIEMSMGGKGGGGRMIKGKDGGAEVRGSFTGPSELVASIGLRQAIQ